MGIIAAQFATAFRDFVTDGIISSGPHDVIKEEVRAIGILVEAKIAEAAVSGADMEDIEAALAPLVAAAIAAQEAAEGSLDQLALAVAEFEGALAAAVSDATEEAEGFADDAAASADRSEAARDVAIAAGVQYPTEAAAVAAIADGAFASYLDADGHPVWGERDGSSMVPLPGPWIGADKVSFGMTTAYAQTLDDMIAGTVVFITDKFGGSYWRANDTAQVIEGQASTAYTFTDEMTFYRTVSSKPFIFDINANADLLRRLEKQNYRDWFAKQTSRDTAQHIAMYADSLGFGQAGASASGATNKIGVATGYGDGSTHNQWQYDQNIPVELEAALDPVRASALTVHNRGYSGDTAVASYLRHRTPPTAGVSVIWLSSVNDVQGATSSGVDIADINTDLTRSVSAYTTALRKFAAREILRGNTIVIMGPPSFASDVGWDGFSSSSMRLASAYNSAANTVADFLDVQFVDVRKDILDQYYIGDIQADSLHFNPVGCKVVGRRLASLFLGQGWRAAHHVQPGSVIVAHPAVANILSNGLTPPTVNVNPQSGGPGLISANPTTLAVSSASPIMIGFYCDTDDMILYANGKAIDSTVTIELDGAALQQDYKSAISAGKTTQISGSPAVSTLARTYTGTHLINRVSKRIGASDALALHVVGRGWHTLTIYNGGVNTVQFDGMEFQSWENERKTVSTTVIRATDSAARVSSSAFAADTVLVFPVAENKVYSVEGFIRYSSGLTPAFKWYLLGPTGWSASGIKGGTLPADETNFNVTVTETGSANIRAFRFNARVSTGANAGTLSFMWGQSVSDASDTKVLAGSFLRVAEGVQ